MKFLSILVLSVAGLAAAKGDKEDGEQNSKGSKGTSIKSQCKQISKLSETVALAANDTKLTNKFDGNATKAEAFKAKASTAATQLATMQSNATLMATCNGIFAAEDTADDCEKMLKWENQAALAANDTKLASKTDGNTTQADAFKAKVAANADKLTALQSNTTLTAICSGLQTQDTCKSMSQMEKLVAQAANTTWLEAKFEGNANKTAKFQAKAAKAQEKLTTMQSNSTLTGICATLKSTTGAGTANSGSDSGSSSGNTGNAVGAGSSAKPVGAMVSMVALVFAGLIML